MLNHESMLAVAERHQRDLLQADALEKKLRSNDRHPPKARERLAKLYFALLSIVA